MALANTLSYTTAETALVNESGDSRHVPQRCAGLWESDDFD
jgi:hypothetical protein